MIIHLEHDLSRSKMELSEKESRINEISQVEVLQIYIFLFTSHITRFLLFSCLPLQLKGR